MKSSVCLCKHIARPVKAANVKQIDGRPPAVRVCGGVKCTSPYTKHEGKKCIRHPSLSLYCVRQNKNINDMGVR
jgi:hypothetical protein